MVAVTLNETAETLPASGDLMKGMTMTSYTLIPTTCPECRAKITCDVPVRLGMGTRQPDYDVECPRCKKTVRLDLPGAPIRCVVRTI